MNYFKNIYKSKPEEAEEEKKVIVEEGDEDDKKEEKEDAKEEKKEDGKEVKKGRTAIPLITSSSKKRQPMSREKWQEMAQIRRWDVRITNISIENLFKEPFDPFIEFVIGGNLRIVPKPTKKGKIENVYVGELGYTKKTEVVKNLECKDTKILATRIHCEFQGSYFDVQEQYLRVDIWDWEKWNLNEFLGRIEVPLIEIIQGDVEQSYLVNKAGEKKKIKLCRINFTISFQEIWDFALRFSDWSGNEIKGEKGENDACPSIELSLMSQGIFGKKVKSKMVEKESNPQWPVLDGVIHYRGTVNDLHNEKLLINLYNGSLLSVKKVGTKVTDLLGIIDSGIVSTDMVQQFRRHGGHTCSIKGRINIQKTPRYRQTGEIIMLNSEGQYLCVSVMRVDNVVLPSDKGAVNTYIELDWGGYLKRTRTAFRTYKPIFNDVFYFPINVPKGLPWNSDQERNKAIMKELHLYSSINFNFWSIDEELSNDSLGSTTFFLNELQNSRIQEKEFFDEKTQSNQVMKIRVWSGKKELKSPFISSGEISNLFIDVWILYENEKKLEYDDLPEAKDDKKPDKYEELAKDWQQSETNMRESFPEENHREFPYEFRDEHDKKHFLPLFLSKLGYPNLSKQGESMVQEILVDYLRVDTLKEHAYFTSLIPFSSSGSEILSSPEFLIHMKKGEIDDHAVFLACLFMSVKKESKDDDFESNNQFDDYKSELETSKKKRKDMKTIESKFSMKNIEEEDLENRVFVCMGSLKLRRTKHLWVMTINSDYKGVKFWEVSNNSSFELDYRVAKPNFLEKYLNKENVEEKGLDIIIEGAENQENEIINDIESVIDEENESSAESVEEEKPKDKKKLDDIRIKLDDLGQFDLRFKYKNAGLREDSVKPAGKSFLDNKRDKEKKDVSNYVSIVQEPRLLKFAKEVELPYRTLDVIFNNKNIFMNMQHFDPGRIIYDIYDDTLWKPFVPKSHQVFGAFYPPPILYPPMHLPSAKKLHEVIVKEIKIGISALRSGKNLGTSWKNQKDPCVELMESHLKFLELAARGEFSEDRVKMEKNKWSIRMRQFMPTNYRMSAIPAHFNYPEPDRITSVLIEKAKAFFVTDRKDTKWAVAVRLFPYVGKIISIRILVASYYPIPGNA